METQRSVTVGTNRRQREIHIRSVEGVGRYRFGLAELLLCQLGAIGSAARRIIRRQLGGLLAERRSSCPWQRGYHSAILGSHEAVVFVLLRQIRPRALRGAPIVEIVPRGFVFGFQGFAVARDRLRHLLQEVVLDARPSEFRRVVAVLLRWLTLLIDDLETGEGRVADASAIHRVTCP